MVLAVEETREVFWGLGLGLKILWYALAGLSVGVFAYGVAWPIAKWRRGHSAYFPPRRELPRRFWEGTKTLFSHRTIKRRDPYVGWAHRFVFYGWIVLFIGTVILAINSDFTEPVLGWRFFEGGFYLGYSLVLDVLGVVLVVGLALMIVRRAVIRPRKLDYHRPDRADDEPQYDRSVYRRGDWAFLSLLVIISVTGYLLEGARMAMDDPASADWSPAGWATARLYEAVGFGTGGLEASRMSLFWFHGLLAIAFVAAIPFTKAAHMLTSYLSLVLRDRRAGKRLRPIPPERAEEPAGYGTLDDFSALHLLHLDACTKCGKCHEACPANAVGAPLSPRDVILDLREQNGQQMKDAGVGGMLGTLLARQGDHRPESLPVVREDGVRAETVWSCMQCNACVEACPVGIEQAPIINQMRRRLVEEGELDGNLQTTLQTIHKSGNSFGENRRRRGRWTRELDFEVKDARKEPVDVLWFVGDYASFDPRSQRVTRTLAGLFREADVDFGILYDGERNSGNDVRRAGEEGLFEALAEHNIGAIGECDFERIVTSDPHSLNTLRNEYPDYGGRWEVAHHTQFLLELIEVGRLDVRDRLSYRVTYHDPCYLGRHVGEYDAPRRILELLGCTLVEMPRNRDNSFCCGAGGGRIWIPDAPGQERPSENRIREAVGLGELDFFVVACPKDVTMYEDAIKTSGHADALQLRELTELIEEALAGTREPAATVE
jgi:Fe-S oxidoreductase/nitrate reductase gamma subunit